MSKFSRPWSLAQSDLGISFCGVYYVFQEAKYKDLDTILKGYNFNGTDHCATMYKSSDVNFPCNSKPKHGVEKLEFL